MKNLIAINDENVTADGLLVKWKCKGGTPLHVIELAMLLQYGDTKPFYRLLNKITVVSALAEAMKVVKHTDKQYLLDSQGSHGKWVLLKRTAEYDPSSNEMPQYESRLHVSIDKEILNSNPITFKNDDGEWESNAANALQYSDPDHPAIKQIERVTQYYMTHLKSRDVSNLLTEFALNDCDGIAWREDGGVYYIPQIHAEKFARIKNALSESTGARIGSIPVLNSEDGVASITESLTAECDRLENGIQQSIQKGVGVRALQSQESKVIAQREKLARYAERMKVSLESLEQRMDSFQHDVTAAMILADGGE